jgi:hypothetical protein
MANTDRPNGFRPVKTFSGAPVSSMIRTVGVADGADIFVGDAIKLSSGLAAASTAHADVILGVAVGFGKKGVDGEPFGMFNPENLNTPNQYYDDSASTHTEWVCYYIPVNDVLFEAQFDGTPTTPVVGQGYGLIYTTGSTTTGQSAQEIDGDDVTDIDVQIVDFVRMPGNDWTAAYGRVLVKFDDAAFPNAAS